MNPQDARQFLLKLEGLRPEVEHYLLSATLAEFLKKLDEKYGVTNDYFTDLIVEAVGGTLKLQDAPKKIQENLRRSGEESKKMALDFLGVVFLPLDPYLFGWGIKELFFSWKGNPNDYEDYVSACVESIWEENDRILEEHVQNFDANRDTAGELNSSVTLFKKLLVSILSSENEENKARLNSSILSLLTASPLNKKALEEALYESEEKISDKKIKLEQKFVEATASNWIKDFIAYYGTGLFDNLVLSEYITGSENTKGLDDGTRKLLIQLLLVYRNLKFFPSSMSDRPFAEQGIIPVKRDEAEFMKFGKIGLGSALARERSGRNISAGAPPPPHKPEPAETEDERTKRAYAAYAGDEKMKVEILRQAEALKVIAQKDKNKLREELLKAVRAKNISRVIAALHVLAQYDDMHPMLEESGMLKKFLLHVWKEKYGEKIAEDFTKNPRDPKFVPMFLRYVLEDRLGQSEHNSARVGAQVGNIYKKIGKPQYASMAYFDMEKKEFRWMG